MSKHTLSVLVENKPAVLTRVAGLFSRRGFNIDSLAVGPTDRPDVSRMTVVVDAADHSVEQVTKQLNKLINVLKIIELEPAEAVRRELLLVKVSADVVARPHVLEVVGVFRGQVVDLAPDSLVIEATGTPEKLDALLRALTPFGVRELAQSGVVALARGRATVDAPLRPADALPATA